MARGGEVALVALVGVLMLLGMAALAGFGMAAASPASCAAAVTRSRRRRQIAIRCPWRSECGGRGRLATSATSATRAARAADGAAADGAAAAAAAVLLRLRAGQPSAKPAQRNAVTTKGGTLVAGPATAESAVILEHICKRLAIGSAPAAARQGPPRATPHYSLDLSGRRAASSTSSPPRFLSSLLDSMSARTWYCLRSKV